MNSRQPMDRVDTSQIPLPEVRDRAKGRARVRPVRDDVLHIRIDSEVKEAFFTLAAQRGVFASELLLALIEDTLQGPR